MVAIHFHLEEEDYKSLTCRVNTSSYFEISDSLFYAPHHKTWELNKRRRCLLDEIWHLLNLKSFGHEPWPTNKYGPEKICIVWKAGF